MYKTLHKKQGSVTVQLRFARSSVTFCAKRDIKKETGVTFLEFLQSVRMDAAKKLLVSGNEGMNVICEKVGYTDVKYFTKCFIKYTGLKPGEYRKIYS